MGWWGIGVMEGDPPYDMLANIEDIVYRNVSEQDDLSEEHACQIIREELAKPEIVKELTDIFDADSRDREIGYQVLAVVAMSAGAYISNDLKATMRQCMLDDEWAKTSEERKAEMDKTISVLDSYDGKTPTIVPQKGLLETMLTALEEGKIGPINKP